MGGLHHQKYKHVKQISKYKADLRMSGRIAQLIKDWHGRIIDGLVFLHETKHPKHEQLSQMINGLVAYVELEHEIVKWTSSIANSLALICNTVHKRCSVASNGSAQCRIAQCINQTVQRCLKWLRVMSNSTACAQTVQRCVKWLSVMQNGTAYKQTV